MRVLVAALVSLVVAAGSAAAAPKLARTAIDGDDSGDIREAVAEALDGKELTVIGAKETNRAVDNLKGGVESLTEKQAKKLSTELEVDAIVYGQLNKVDGNKVLKLRLFVNGKKAKGFSVQFSNPKSKKFKDAVRNTMLARVQEKLDGDDKPDKVEKKKGKSEDEDEEDPIAKKGKKGKKGDKAEKTAKSEKSEKSEKGKKGKKPKAEDEDEGEDAPKKGKKKVAKAEGEDEGDEDAPKGDKKKGKKKVAAAEEDGEEDGEVGVAVRVAPAHSANRLAARIDLGVSASTRTLTFTTTPELRADNNDPKPFRPGPVAGARLEGEVYPLAFSNPKSFAAGLGVAFEYDKTISSKVQTTLEPGAVGQVNQQHFLVGGRVRIPFGSTATAPSVTVGMGFGKRTFVVKPGGLMNRADLDLPDTDYKYLAPMIGFRIPFTANVALSAVAEAMLIQDAGPIVTAQEYGKAKVFGFDAEPGLDIILGNRFAIRFAFEMAQIGYTFTGGGAKANNRDGNPDSIDIGGALDRSIGGLATFGVLY